LITPFASGSHSVAVPDVASNAAPRLRVMFPLTVVNAPPAYTVEPETAIALTVLFTFGFQAVAAPFASNAANRFLVTAPLSTVVNDPPA
jgi:hypothetical protein